MSRLTANLRRRLKAAQETAAALAAVAARRPAANKAHRQLPVVTAKSLRRVA